MKQRFHGQTVHLVSALVIVSNGCLSACGGTSPDASGGTEVGGTSGGSVNAGGSSGSGGAAVGCRKEFVLNQAQHEPLFLRRTSISDSATQTLPSGFDDYWLDASTSVDVDLDATKGTLRLNTQSPGIREFRVNACGNGTRVSWLVRWPVEDFEASVVPKDRSEAGPYAVGQASLTIPSIDVSVGSYKDIAVALYFPENQPKASPLVVFHHATHTPQTIFRDYGSIHSHWASYGFVVASVDDTAANGGRTVSYSVLNDMAGFIIAALEEVGRANSDPSSPLFQRVDMERVVASGHSRGGGAALIALRRDSRFAGAVSFAPVAPVVSLRQDFSDPLKNGAVPLPPRPVLITAAEDDTDVTWPAVDAAYDFHTGASMLVTVCGANHEWTYDQDTPGSAGPSRITWEERQKVDRHYSTAFLLETLIPSSTGAPTLFARSSLSTSLSTLGVRVAMDRATLNRIVVDDGGTADGSTPQGLPIETKDATVASLCRYASRDSEFEQEYDGELARLARHRMVKWNAPGAEWHFPITAKSDGEDLTRYASITARMSWDCLAAGGAYEERCSPPPHEIAVVLRDAGGTRVELPLDLSALGHSQLAGPSWSTAIVALSAARLAGLNLERIASIGFKVALPASGQLWIDDLVVE